MDKETRVFFRPPVSPASVPLLSFSFFPSVSSHLHRENVNGESFITQEKENTAFCVCVCADEVWISVTSLARCKWIECMEGVEGAGGKVCS